MKKNESVTAGSVASEEAMQAKKFWRRAFAVYAAIEVVVIVLQYFITRSKCSDCVMPLAFYGINWLLHLLFTGFLWVGLHAGNRLRPWQQVISGCLIFAVYYFLWLLVMYGLFHSGQLWLVQDTAGQRPFSWFVYYSWADIGKFVLKLSAFFALKFYFDYRQAEKRRIQLAVINKDMQLNLLRQQLSPHFYFNTLNNLYGLARSNNANLQEALEQLNGIMRYVIVECNQPRVLLQQEIIFLRSYIALEKLRYEQDTVIEMKVQGNPEDYTILPLLLIQFVENAFKHGMKEKSEKNWMKALLLITGGELVFSVSNSADGQLPEEGIGINSVKHILQLQYEGRHQLEIDNKDNLFSVTLKMNVA
jgi:hypothetical protein